MAAWGFTYVTAGAWAKRSRTGKAWHIGTGYHLRSATEFYLIGKVGRHSHKPGALHASLELLYDGPYVELFAAGRRLSGWDAWDGIDHTAPEYAKAAPVEPVGDDRPAAAMLL